MLGINITAVPVVIGCHGLVKKAMKILMKNQDTNCLKDRNSWDWLHILGDSIHQIFHHTSTVTTSPGDGHGSILGYYQKGLVEYEVDDENNYGYGV